MKKSTRRNFIATSTFLGIAGVAATASGDITDAAPAARKDSLPPVVHHVFFWLKSPDSAEDRAALIEGIKKLGSIETVRAIHVGVPASTEKRDVVESSYHVSELLCFDDLEGQKTYQDHPDHQQFIKDHSHLWEKVVVYDVIAA